MIKRIDAFDINFVDSAARKEFKLDFSTGTGESRIYVGKDEKRYDDFFEFDNIEYFVTEKKDLKKYLKDAYNEFMFPSQPYKENVTEMYDKLLKETNEIPRKNLKYSFRKTFDNQNRYYIVLKPGSENKQNYKYIRNIVLPRITKFCFIKFVDDETNKKYIYMRPILFNNLRIKEEIEEVPTINYNSQTKRLKQSAYRERLLENMPFCPFTLVADDRILVACHIKPFSKCESDEEKYDSKNGITMTPTYHTLFDLGYISFEDDGRLLVSPFLSNITKNRLNLKDGDKKRLQTGSAKYLKYHRDNIFCKMPIFSLDDFADDN